MKIIEGLSSWVCERFSWIEEKNRKFKISVKQKEEENLFPVSIVTAMPETVSNSVGSSPFGDLRGVQWRIDLGILPSYSSASIDDLRRVTANSRRRYAALRRQLLVDPHVPKDGSNSPELVIDNPLSQNPDSMWGRFFRNAELERMVDQDLTRLYPERGSYFQTSGCQGMLRRILLLWCLSQPDYGYRQGMHELLAPLLYVLHVDVERLTEVRKTHEDHFIDKFDGFSFHENDFTYRFDFKKFSESIEDGSEKQKKSVKASTLTDLDPAIQIVILLSDAYGAEGELGIVISEKFMEHDAYSMFDALMSGAGGAVAMAEFFSLSPYCNSHTVFTPVTEASAAMYYLLSIVDSPLHTHLIELGVEPQYFSLRWLRVLFGREFSLEDLLVIWDEIFSFDNARSMKAADNDAEANYGVLDSPRGAFISAFAVSMILNLRSSLLATENATACLQRLLNFPDDVNLVKLLTKAKSLITLAIDVNNSNSLYVHPGLNDGKKPVVTRGHSLPLDSTSPRTPLNVVPDSYWEEKWRVLHNEEENKKCSVGEKAPSIRKGWSERVRLRLSRTESDPSPSKKTERTKHSDPSVRRSLLDDLAKQLGSEDNEEKAWCNEDVEQRDSVEVYRQDVAYEQRDSVEVNGQDITSKKYSDISSGTVSEENSPNYSTSPVRSNTYQENETESSSVASNSSVDENDAESCGTNPQCSPFPLPRSSPPLSTKSIQNNDSLGKSATGMERRRSLSSKFQWLLTIGRNASEGTSKRPSASEGVKDSNGGSGQNSVVGFSVGDGCDGSSGTCKGEIVDQNLMVSLRNLGLSMQENIQVIESVFQQDQAQMGAPEYFSKNSFVEKGQVTAMAALKELRKISNILSEM